MNTHKDDFHDKIKHINMLFDFLKSNNDAEFITYLSKLSINDVDVNIKDDQGNYLVFLAVMMNRSKILKMLIDYGAQIDVLDSEGYSIMYYPIKFNYLEIIHLLIESNKKVVGISLVNIIDARGNVPLFYAIRHRNIEILRELLLNGANANYRNNDFVTALQLAVLKKNVDIVKILIKYVKNIDVKNSLGSTALHNACNFQLTEITKILMDNGADQNIPETEYDFYPIFYPVVQNNIEITKLLINYEANPNNQDYIGNTILHYCIINKHFEILDYIMNHYKIIIRETTVYTEDINQTETYVSGIDPTVVNIDGLTAVHLMLYDYQDAYKIYLLNLIPYSNPNYQDNKGNTMLHIIAEKNLWNIFKDVLRIKKLNIFIKNNEGKTVMDMIQLRERENFLDTVVKSYYNYLKKHESTWLLKWQNECSAQDQQEINEEKCYKYIREAILKEKISIPAKKNKISISIVPDETVQFSTFTGSLLDMIVGYKYLTIKYPQVTSLFHTNQEHDEQLDKYTKSLGIYNNTHQYIIQFEIRWIFQRIFFPPNFESVLADIITSKKYRFVIIPIGIILSNGNHSNSLFYDLEKQVIERFEPHGSSYPAKFNYNPNLLDETLRKRLTSIVSNIHREPITINYHAPKDYLPKIGFQSLDNSEINVNKNIGDPNGFCTLWTIWFLDYRFEYIDKNPGDIVKNLINEIKINNYSFRTIIRNYSRKITDLRDKYLGDIDRNINDYLNNRLSASELKKLAEFVTLSQLR